MVRRFLRWWHRIMQIGVGDLKILLGQFLSTTTPVSFSGAVSAQTPFAEFKATTGGMCGIFVGVDTSGVHLSLADLTMDGQFRGVDSGRYLMVDDWNMLQFALVAGHDYAFQTNGDCDIAIVVATSPLMA